ncbi:MAG TPA: PilN domain-containing protein, partial [Longimicrobiaceae bacterium]|nr:PilN domain-containing protein [Longimicrobiaceae bacterium]
PEAQRAAAARRIRQRAVAFLSASVVVLLLSAGVHLWGVRRELELVQSRRAAIADAVADAQRARESVNGLRMRLETLAELEEKAPRWTPQFAALAQALPDSAYLQALTADSTGLRLGGLARSASGVVPALQASPRFDRVALAAPLRWDSDDAGERFDVAASLEEPPRSAPSRSTP